MRRAKIQFIYQFTILLCFLSLSLSFASALNRTMEPSILAELTLSDGKVKTFEVPVSKFHELRYNVAYVLREMDSLEQRSILKVQD